MRPARADTLSVREISGKNERQPPVRGSTSILVVEDEADLADLLCYNLERAGYSCRRADDGAQALDEVRRNPPDLILLDRMLPRVPGDDVVMHLKRDPRYASIPIVMLTAKAAESDELMGFALGADDYVPKPFSMKKLLARVAAVLRRSQAGQRKPEQLAAGPFALDRGRHELKVGDAAVNLTATEFRLLSALMGADSQVLSRAELIDAAVGTGAAVTDRTIDVHITSVRKKIASAPSGLEASKWIQTVRGVGYTFRQPDQD